MKIKRDVENGSYDFDKNIDKVVDALIKESNSESPISLPLFD